MFSMDMIAWVNARTVIHYELGVFPRLSKDLLFSAKPSKLNISNIASAGTPHPFSSGRASLRQCAHRQLFLSPRQSPSTRLDLPTKSS